MRSPENGGGAAHPAPDQVSRARYDRERAARKQAEALLEAHSRQLFEANQLLKQQAEVLEQAVRQRTADLEAARQEAVSASQAKSVFLASMSHEIRTPMNGVLGMASELRETPLDQRQLGMLSVIIESGDLLLSVINDVLDLSKIEAGHMALEQRPCDLTQILASADRLFGLKAAEKGLAFEVQKPEGMWIESDPTRLRQIVGNLLSNAIKFTERGAVDLRTEFLHPAIHDGAGELRILVTDTGIGMTPQQMARLFTPYMQASTEIAPTFGGTGLGLAITRQFCRMMGGDLVVASTEGQGSRFTASIMARQIAAKRPDPPGSSSELAFVERLRAGPLDILVAEDNRTNQLVLTSMLGRFGLRPRITDNGQALVEAWRQARPDVILMDVQMPIMGGIEATATIRAAEIIGDLRRTPIIALSANAMTHHLEEYETCGMDASLPKPVRRAALVQAILSVLPQPGKAAE